METILNLKCLRFYLAFGIFVLFNIIFTDNVLNAQTSGTIEGLVTDSNTGEGLVSANIQLEGEYFGVASDRFGDFKISKVPFGTYTLTVSYIGYAEYTTEVTLSANEPAVTHDVVMNLTAMDVGTVVVEGLLEGQMKALNEQRTAKNIKNVVSREQMAKFPDLNAAESVKRLPGVAIERALGEGRYVLIRGTEPRLSNFTVNGQTLASTRRKERFSQLDIVGSNQMASLEVVKALTPDMDGNAIGGTVNIVTRSAFDHVGRKVFLSGAVGYPNLGDASYQGQMSYSDQLGENKNFGVSITANWDRRNNRTETTKYKWGDREDELGNTIPMALRDFRTQPTNFIKERYGFSADLEYKLDDKNRFFVRGSFNQFDDKGLTSDRFRVRVDKGDYIDANTIEGAKLVRQTKNRVEALQQTAYSLGGVHEFDALNLDYTLAYSHGEEMHPDELLYEFAFSDKVDLQLDLSNPIAPQWDITNLDNNAQYDASRYELDGIEYAPTTSNNDNITGSVNLILPYNFSGYQSELKFGAKLTHNTKDRGHEGWKYGWEGAGDLTFADFIGSETISGFGDGNYTHGPVSDYDKLYDFFDREKDNGLEGEYDLTGSKGATFEATEDIYAGYVMTTNTFGKFMFLGGARYEQTQVDYTANALHYADDGSFEGYNEVNEQDSYGNLLPMLHMRYTPTNMTNIRFAFTQTISRPNYWDIAPRYRINRESETISKGNVALLPTTATSVDLMGEHYLGSVGVLSAGMYYKKLGNIIYGSGSIIESGIYEGYWESMPVNGGDASLYGYELNWQQQFSFLPGFWNGFGISVNYNHTWAETELTDREGFLPGQAGDTGNLSLSYEKYGFSGRLSLSFQGSFIKSIGSDADNDQYIDDYTQLDFSANQKIYDGLDFFLEVINITDQAQLWYLGDEDHPLEKRIYSWRMMAGVRWDMTNLL